MPTIPLLSTLLTELGLTSLYSSQYDIKILILQRFTRFFAYGGSTIVLALYLHSLQLSETQSGLFMTLALLGDVISFGLALVADGVGRRRVLGFGAVLMAGSGVVLGSGIVMASNNNHSSDGGGGMSAAALWLLLGVAVFGVVSPNGREIGPFSAIEESTIAHLTPAHLRSDVFAWYTVIGSAGSSCGKLVTGWAVQHLQTLKGWDPIRSYRTMFLAYAVLGLTNVVLSCLLSSEVEIDKNNPGISTALGRDEDGSRQPLLIDQDQTTPLDTETGNPTREKGRTPWLPKISKESRSIVIQLCLLFALDSLASGLTPASWVTYFFHLKFNLREGSLGSLFFATGLLSAISSILAASLARRIGLVNTMVFTHLPSAIALALIPVPGSLPGAVFFLVIRSSLASMDIAPKAAFLSAVVLPTERTAVMAFVNVVRTGSQSCGPLLTGVLVQAGRFWVAFVVAGALKAGYDLGLLALFRGHEAARGSDRGRRKMVEDEEVDGITGESRNDDSDGDNNERHEP